MLANRVSRKVDDSWKREPIDDVYALKYYKWIVYSFVDAVKAHRETHHPEMYNKPNAELFVTIELNMRGEKKVISCVWIIFVGPLNNLEYLYGRRALWIISKELLECRINLILKKNAPL